jgi:hypothetical protein
MATGPRYADLDGLTRAAYAGKGMPGQRFREKAMGKKKQKRMTEAEWLACTDPEPMLEFLRGKASERKMRLFACACCRRIWGVLEHPLGREAVEVAERYADRKETKKELSAATYAAAFAGADFGSINGLAVLAALSASADEDRALDAAGVAACAAPDDADERIAQCGLFRDIAGNPFRPVSLDPAWRTPTVRALAQAAYEERILPAGTLDPTRLAVLSDALEETGCDNADILSHLRGPGPHVRGCWVVDAILGKK